MTSSPASSALPPVCTAWDFNPFFSGGTITFDAPLADSIDVPGNLFSWRFANVRWTGFATWATFGNQCSGTGFPGPPDPGPDLLTYLGPNFELRGANGVLVPPFTFPS